MTKNSDKLQKIYHFSDLSAYSLKQRLLIYAADLAFYLLVRLIGASVRFEIKGRENLEAIEKAGKLPIYTVWHNRLFLATYFFRQRGIVMMSSQSFDAEYIGRFIKRLGYGTIRGSSTRGGVGALVEMIRMMKQGLPMGFTIDGPKGPKYVVKEGALTLAKKTGNPVMPFCLTAKSFWEVKSWDKLQIPKPFSRVLVSIAEPFYVAEDADATELAIYRNELQKVLDDLVEEGEKWRKSSIS